jgi:hypothetical protein
MTLLTKDQDLSSAMSKAKWRIKRFLAGLHRPDQDKSPLLPKHYEVHASNDVDPQVTDIYYENETTVITDFNEAPAKSLQTSTMQERGQEKPNNSF